MLSPELFNILACPACKGDLELQEGSARLHCRGCGLAYPIVDGIPVLLTSAAEKIVTPGSVAPGESSHA